MFAVLNSRKVALDELKHRGYKIEKSKFYKDCSLGLCKVEQNGSVLESSLDEYIKVAHLRKLDEPYFARKRRIKKARHGFILVPIDLHIVRRILDVEELLSADVSEKKLDGNLDE